MLMSKKGVYESLPISELHTPAYMRKTTASGNRQAMQLWRLDKAFKFHLHSASYVNVKEADLIYVRAGIFHGTEALCQVRQSKSVPHSSPRWDEWLEFEDMLTLDLPRAAKLCLSICSVKKRKNRDETTMLCWGNISLFDWRSHLLSDKVSLNLWSVPRGMDDLLNPLGIVGSNPVQESPCLELNFERHNSAVSYPSIGDFQEFSKFLEELAAKATATTSSSSSSSSTSASAAAAVAGASAAVASAVATDQPQETISQAEKNQLVAMAKRDPLAEISEQEKVTLWRLRKHCLDVPEILPRFLDAVKWNSRNDLTHLYMLLKIWPEIPPQSALELLDCKYADPTVRALAVVWLDKMSDEDLAQYLLQLVQTLKYEPYLNNPLSNLLLKRALLNRKIGHFFFWHLKSELHSPAHFVRFGLLLEAFCRGLGPFLKKLIKQVEALDKLTKLTDSLKDKFGGDSVKDRMKFMSEQIQQVSK